jgi:hypothetical protein
VFSAAASLPWDLRSVAPEEMSLEDVFVDAVSSPDAAR